MHLNTELIIDEDRSVARVTMDGFLNADTAPELQAQLDEAIRSGMQLTVMDMKGLEYISSAGVRVILGASKQLKSENRRLASANRRPHIAKVFNILRALPDMTIFADDEEMDAYLAKIQFNAFGSD